MEGPRMELETDELTFDQKSVDIRADCATTENVEVRGHQAAKGGNAHLAYNTDGYYVWAAACYVVSQFKKAAG